MNGGDLELATIKCGQTELGSFSLQNYLQWEKSHSRKSYAIFPSSSLVTDSVIRSMRESDHNGMQSSYLKSQNMLSG